MIDECLSKDPAERPTFDIIFKKLSYNIETQIYDSAEEDICEIDQFKYCIGDVDIEKVNGYIDSIEQQNMSEEKSGKIIEIEAENKKLKNENKKQSVTIKTLEEEIRQLKSENKKSKAKDQKPSNTIKNKEKGQEKSKTDSVS